MAAKRKTLWKALAIVVVCVLGLLLVGWVMASRGLSEMQALEIKDVDPAQLDDGEYTGDFEAFRWSHRVQVTVEGQRIVEIVPVQQNDSAAQHIEGQSFVQELIPRIKQEQTPAVDAVSGATVSSNALLKAVEKALTDPEEFKASDS